MSPIIRPVSLLWILRKILKKIVLDIILVWCVAIRLSARLINHPQFVELHYQFCHAISQNKKVRIVFLNITKAFDRVWHAGLLHKLKLKKWGSAPKIPKRSVLGPILFLVFINDLTYVVNHCKIRLFADDTLLRLTTVINCSNCSKANQWYVGYYRLDK